MTIEIIPTFEDPFSEQYTPLEGRTYLLGFRYNQRQDCWYLNISTAEGDPLVLGIKIVCSVNLIRRHKDLLLPPGRIIALSGNDDDSPPGLDELGEGKRVQLYYVSSDETLTV